MRRTSRGTQSLDLFDTPSFSIATSLSPIWEIYGDKFPHIMPQEAVEYRGDVTPAYITGFWSRHVLTGIYEGCYVWKKGSNKLIIFRQDLFLFKWLILYFRQTSVNNLDFCNLSDQMIETCAF